MKHLPHKNFSSVFLFLSETKYRFCRKKSLSQIVQLCFHLDVFRHNDTNLGRLRRRKAAARSKKPTNDFEAFEHVCDVEWPDWSLAMTDIELQLLYLQCSNDRNQERRRKRMYRFMANSLEIAWHPVRIDWYQFHESQVCPRIWTRFRSNRMPLLYHLRRHHCLQLALRLDLEALLYL